MLGLSGVKGTLESDADADLVVLEEVVAEDGVRTLRVDQVWKFGVRVFDRGE
jgi:N-acetylglucosamine-6-phosphate deacetylase